MKKILVFLVVIIALTITFVSCTGGDSHKHSYNKVVTEPTCTEQGYTTYTCECGDSYVGDFVDPTHTFGDWLTIIEPTISTEGLKERYCNICEQTESVVIDKLIPSRGLEFALNDDGESYSVVGIGACTDTDIVIPTMYKDLPVTSIGPNAFYYCSSLTSVVIPDSVTNIGDWAFCGCISITSIKIPDSVISIDYGPFEGCRSLKSIEVDANNECYCSINGNLYNRDATILIKYAIGKTDTEFIIPDFVTSIGNSAFKYCDSLTSVKFGDNSQLTNIGDWAFSYCDSFTSVEFGDNSQLTSIGDGVFTNCDSLTSVVIPDSVTSIGDRAFRGCDSLTSVEIPDSVISIGELAFYNCTSLTIYCEAESKPNGWDSSWNPSNRPVVWGYKGE